jgi:tetratricopeptide (TPR) repeat protein
VAGEVLAEGAEALLEAAFRTGDYGGVEALLRSALEQAMADGDRATEAATLDRLGWLAHFQALDRGRDPTGADGEEALFRRALAIRQELDDPAGAAAALFGIGLVHQVLRRDWDAAMPYFREALALADRYGDLLTRSEVHRHVGFYYLAREVRLDEARHHLGLSLRLRERHGDLRWIPSGTQALGEVEAAAGNRAGALRLLREAVRQAAAAGLRPERIETARAALRRVEAG